MAKRLLTTDELLEALRGRTEGNAETLDAALEKAHVRELAVLMCDSSGFSRKTNEYGILQFLAVMTHCYDNLIPLCESRRGKVLSHDADNLLAVFERPADAVAAAVDMHRWLRGYNEERHDREQYNVCIGIHYGKVLRLKDNVFGSVVNTAAKMGEDLAGKDEILVTAEVAKRAGKRYRVSNAPSTTLGGRAVKLYRVKY
jgi:adenylate cyclase